MDLSQLLQVIGGILSVLAPVAIYLFGRKAQVRRLNTASDVDSATVKEKSVTAQDKMIERLQEEGDRHREDLRELRAEVDALKDREQRAQLDFARQLRDANGENARLQTRVAQLTNDLFIANRQLEDYRSLPRHRSPDGI